MGGVEREDDSESGVESGLGDFIQTLLLWLEEDGLLDRLDGLDSVQSSDFFSDLLADGQGNGDSLSDGRDGDLSVWVLGSQEQFGSSVDVSSSGSISSDSDFVLSWGSIVLGDGFTLVFSLGGGSFSFCHLNLIDEV